MDISKLLDSCANVTILDNVKFRIKHTLYNKLTNEEKQEVNELIKQSNNIPFFSFSVNINDINIHSSTIKAIKLVEENKVIGFYITFLLTTGKYKGLYKSPTVFINPEYRGKGYGKELLEKYFSNRKGVRWIDNADKKKQLLFSSFGFTKTENQAVNYDDITLGTFWVKK